MWQTPTACWSISTRPPISCKAVEEAERLRIAFIVTDDDRRFQTWRGACPSGRAGRLYESYLTNFRFANGE